MEHTVSLRCLYSVADRLLTLLKKIVFRAAFGVCILFQVVLLALLLAAISHFVPEDNFVVGGILVASFFIGQFVIGAASYLVFQRMTHVQYIAAASERWLAERREADNHWIKRRKTFKQWAVWIPTSTVILVCLFFDTTWALTSHLLHPGRGRLIGCEVPIPLTWTITYNDVRISGGGAQSIVVAQRYRGLIRAGSGLYLGRRPPFSVSNMNFRSIPAGDPLATKPASTILSEGTLPFGNGIITCREEAPPRWMTEPRYIHCSTPTGNFSGNFSGNDEDAAEFYRVLMRVKRGD